MKNKNLKTTVSTLFFFLLLTPALAWSNSDIVAVGTWNVRQLSNIKMEREIPVVAFDTQMPIKNFISNWIVERDLDVLAMQEVYEEHVLDTNERHHPIDHLIGILPDHYKVIKGESIRASIAKGNNKVWREFCPIIYNSQKVNCYTSKDSMVPTRIDGEMVSDASLRRGHWAYCQTLDKKFDFVFTCLHANYTYAKKDLEGLQTVIHSIVTGTIDLPKELRLSNTDYIFAGDYNLDRRSARAYGRWEMELEGEHYVLDKALPVFPKGTAWKSKAFTKLKDIHTFAELDKRSVDLYDDVVGTPSVDESLLNKWVDPMIDSYFIDASGEVDTESLLGVSDHLPVISEYDSSIDTD